MEAFKLADAIREEIKRQAKNAPTLEVANTDKPDTIRVVGEIDLYELAKVLVD